VKGLLQPTGSTEGGGSYSVGTKAKESRTLKGEVV